MASYWTQEVTYDWPQACWEHKENCILPSPNQLGFDLIHKPMMDEMKSMICQAQVDSHDESFALFDMGLVIERYNTWRKCFPDIEPHFAVKAHDDPAVVALLAYLGAGMDCASKREIQHVLKSGTTPSKIIFSNTAKFPSHIEYAVSKGVSLMTFDNKAELDKIKDIAPNARLVLRIAPQAHFAVQYALKNKFGCEVREAEELLQHAQDLGLNVTGVSFHTGSGVCDPQVYITNIEAAKCVFDIATEMGIHMNLLDIGGGFFGSKDAELKLEKMCGPINETLRLLFPKTSGVKVISEPGRYFVEGSMALAACVIGKRIKKCCNKSEENNPEKRNDGTTGLEYYLSESASGALSFHIGIDNHDYRTIPVTSGHAGNKKYKSKLWGPTCNSADFLQESCDLPELQIGDWLIFPDVGCYSLCKAGTFNGMPLCPIRRVMQEDMFRKICPECPET